jgi:hypothetical protein
MVWTELLTLIHDLHFRRCTVLLNVRLEDLRSITESCAIIPRVLLKMFGPWTNIGGTFQNNLKVISNRYVELASSFNDTIFLYRSMHFPPETSNILLLVKLLVKLHLDKDLSLTKRIAEVISAQQDLPVLAVKKSSETNPNFGIFSESVLSSNL